MSGSSLAPTPTGPHGSARCGPDYEGGWRWWFLIPLGLLGVFIATVVAIGWLVPSDRWSGPAPFFWPIFPFGFFLFFVVVFVALRWVTWGRGWGGSRYWREEPSAGEIARQRYARGEISREDFQRILRDLGETEAVPR